MTDEQYLMLYRSKKNNEILDLDNYTEEQLRQLAWEQLNQDLIEDDKRIRRLLPGAVIIGFELDGDFVGDSSHLMIDYIEASGNSFEELLANATISTVDSNGGEGQLIDLDYLNTHQQKVIVDRMLDEYFKQKLIVEN